MLGFRRVILCLGLAPELLAAFIANQAAGHFTRLKLRAFFGPLSNNSSLDFVDGFVLIRFEPFEGTLDCW